ncbi:MAG: polyphosphate--glucose phosphotransferase [Saprospiraceae bacterium]
MHDAKILGVDVGASGIKGAIVEVQSGKLLTERLRLPTPNPSTPEAMAETFGRLVKSFSWNGLVGVGFPAIVKNGKAMTAANIDKSWIHTNIEAIFGEASGCMVKVMNDADAAGMAEMRFGLGKGVNGTVILITIGSGLGSALFVDGKIVPNTEFGHLYLKGQHIVAEQFASNNAKDRDNLSWEEWAKRFNEYLQHLELLFSPNLILLGGGSSKYFEEYTHFFTLETPVQPALLLNSAGMVGAACYAYETVLAYAK